VVFDRINLITRVPKPAILPAMPQLTNRRHEIFAIELAAGAPLLIAYLTAGYRESYSARFNASRLRNTPKIKDRINELLQEFGERTRIKLEWVQETIAPLLEIDPAELYQKPDPADPTKVQLKPLQDLPARVRKAITRIKVDPETGRPVEVFLTDKVAVGALLVRSLVGPDASVNNTLNVSLGDRLDQALRRVRAGEAVATLAPPRPAQPAQPAALINKADLPMEL
jgi:hypothetical protein